MDTKLSLMIDRKVMERAKAYSKDKEISLSKLIESYLQYLTSDIISDANKITPLVKSLSGVLQSGKNSNTKKKYKKHILKKYSI